MAVLILKNVESEGPGTIETYLRERGIGYRIVNCPVEQIPPIDEFDTLVMMGGPMSVNETDLYPYIREEIDLTAAAVRGGKRVLGICLGAQIMAKALGAPVYAGNEKEIGWYDIEIYGAGLSDKVMNQVALHPRAGDYWRRFKVFHWHGETFDIPEGAAGLARSDLYPNQAFRFGDKAYAFQFHLEVTSEMIYDWLRNEPVDMGRLRQQTEQFYAEYAGRALNFYKAFFE